jgi:hypothetical protein
MAAETIEHCLETVLHRTAPDAAPKDFAPGEFPAAFSSLGWRLRHHRHTLSSDEHRFLIEAGLAAPELLCVSDFARIHLLLRALGRLPQEQHAGFVDSLLRKGDNKEREALLRGLVLMPSPEQFLATAIDSCRAAVQTTFEAIACENAYPAKYFPPEAFRAMVLKALHLGVSVHRIHGLDGRKDDGLCRMAADYASELQAAGRTVPADVAIILNKEE